MPEQDKDLPSCFLPSEMLLINSPVAIYIFLTQIKRIYSIGTNIIG